jgi:hypothetical protein
MHHPHSSQQEAVQVPRMLKRKQPQGLQNKELQGQFPKESQKHVTSLQSDAQVL